jgi:undecaprenyl-diphosphatase
LVLPAVFGSGLYKLTDIGKNGQTAQWGPTILATIIAFAVGYVVIAWLMAFHQDPQLRAVRDLPAGPWRTAVRADLHRRARDPNAGPAL